MGTDTLRHRSGIDAAYSRANKAYDDKATELDLSGLGLSDIPDVVFTLTDLRFLDLSGNALRDVPGAIARLQALEVLHLHSNRLAKLPAALGRLRFIRHLNLSSNALARLPDEIGSCIRLRDLLLSDNEISTLPDAIRQLAHLERLSLRGNSFVHVPVSICDLHNLVDLDLSGNHLVDLPDHLCDLRTLALLDVRDNALVFLPPSFKDTPSLNYLYLHGNHGLHLPREILGPTPLELVSTRSRPAAPGDILDYYFKIRDKPRPLNEAKLILVGFGDVGKTSIVDRLIYNSFDPQQRKTQGIQITDWYVRLRPEDEVCLHVWDFGGQEIMHATHQFFLTRRSLYLLVLNGRQGQENSDANYWLSIINSFAADCPIIVVLNKIGVSRVDIARRSLEREFPNIKCFVETDCNYNVGIAELRDAIKRETDQMPHLRDAFPGTWYEIKAKVAVMKENFLTFHRYQEMCKEYGENNAVAQTKLASFLHNLGVVLHYADDPRLNDTHVLNPRWVTEGIYSVIDSDYLRSKKGELSTSALSMILEEEVYPTYMHKFFIELMRKFELCFPFLDNTDRYLIPDLLDKEEPANVGEFDEANCLLFEYRYPVLPEGLVPRFIARTYVLSANQPRWRHGAILEFEGNEAVVRGDSIKKTVRVSIRGNPSGRQRLLAVIRSEFEHIHATYSFKPEAMVPLPWSPHLAVKYEDLRTLEDKGVTEHLIIQDGDLHTYNVKTLLEGVDLRDEYLSSRSERHSVRIFYSYSHVDEVLRDELATHLTILEREKLIVSWHDRRISIGSEWPREIDANLRRANLILLLVSSDFLNSDYCYDKEMTCALDLARGRKARVVPVILRPCDWRKSRLGFLSALPKDGRAITDWGAQKYDRDKAWTSVVEGVRQTIKEIAVSRH